jgi:hypothetical protein
MQDVANKPARGTRAGCFYSAYGSGLLGQGWGEYSGAAFAVSRMSADKGDVPSLRSVNKKRKQLSGAIIR